MGSIKIKILSLLLIGFLSGCATSYQPNGFSGGYSDMKLNKDIYQVTFNGNGYTSGDRVQRFFLRRCAEVTLEQGFDFFALVNQEAQSNQYATGGTYNGTATPSYGGGYNYYGSSSVETVTKHSRTGVIKLFKAGSQPEISYDAKEVMRNTATK